MEPPVLHIENFIEDANKIHNEIMNYPWKQDTIKIFGKTVLEPRKVIWFAPKDLEYSYSNKRHIPMEMTPLLANIKNQIEEKIFQEFQREFKFNSVFCNLYENGGNYIGWHSDDEKGLGEIIASISLGAARDFKLRRNSDKKTWTYNLKNGDLLVMYGDCQKRFKHSLPKRKKICEPRINLTYRWFNTK